MMKNRLKSRHPKSYGSWKVRVLKIKCPDCGSQAIIKKTNRKHRDIADIYCACADVECGHTFVMNLTFSHTLSPSSKSGDAMLQQLISNMSPQQKQITLDLLQSASA